MEQTNFYEIQVEWSKQLFHSQVDLVVHKQSIFSLLLHIFKKHEAGIKSITRLNLWSQTDLGKTLVQFNILKEQLISKQWAPPQSKFILKSCLEELLQLNF